MEALLPVLIVFALVMANGFFVAAEFALVTARQSRIDQLAASGSPAARLVKAARADPNRFISAAQLGITVASLLLGWFGEETFAHLIYGPISVVVPADLTWISAHGIASALALTLITFMHITLGEQVPKMLALQRAESVILFAAPPTEILSRIFRPFIALLYAFTNFVLRIMRLEFHAEEHAVHSPDELRLLIGRTAEAGLLSAADWQLVERAFAFGGQNASEAMVPRTEVIALSVDATAREVWELARRHRHTNFPVYEGTIDNIVGVLSTKDLLVVRERRGDRTGTRSDVALRLLARPPVIVSESAGLTEVLARMKASRQPMAVVLDEFGGTSGVITLKDIVARLVGEVGDEYATEGAHEIRVLADGTVLVDGLVLVEDVNQRLGVRLDRWDVDTIGGLVFSAIGRRPEVGDEVDIGSGYCARVERLDGLRIERVRLVSIRR